MRSSPRGRPIFCAGWRRRRATPARMSWQPPASKAPTRDGGLIRLNGIDIATRFLVGADGARSRVAEAFGLSTEPPLPHRPRGRTGARRRGRPALPALLRRFAAGAGLHRLGRARSRCHPARPRGRRRPQARPRRVHGAHRGAFRLEPHEGDRPAQRPHPVRRPAASAPRRPACCSSAMPPAGCRR